MKKYISYILLILCVLALIGCGESSSSTFKATILEITDNSYLVEPVEGSVELKSADQIMVAMKNLDSSLEPEVGDIIEIKYSGTIMETYPAQISDVLGIKVVKEAEHWALTPMVMVNGELYLDTGYDSTIDGRCGTMDGEITSEVEGWEKPTEDNQSNFGIGYGYQYGSTEGTIEIYMNGNWRIFATEEVRQQIQFPEASSTDEMIIYNRKEYKKSELCDATLHWLGLSEQERIASSYMPPEFMEFDETRGISLEANDVTPTGLTIKCTQSGGEPTGDLQTGSWYIVENWTQENGWKEMPFIVEGDIAWTQEAWMISKDATTEWQVNWEWLYGELLPGKYRIGKEIMDFRGSGDYDKTIYFSEFEILE